MPPGGGGGDSSHNGWSVSVAGQRSQQHRLAGIIASVTSTAVEATIVD
jgi:hypothetical protein